MRDELVLFLFLGSIAGTSWPQLFHDASKTNEASPSLNRQGMYSRPSIQTFKSSVSVGQIQPITDELNGNYSSSKFSEEILKVAYVVQGNYLTAFATSSGSTLWTTFIGCCISSNLALDVTKGIIYGYFNNSGTLGAFSTSQGALLWTQVPCRGRFFTRQTLEGQWSDSPGILRFRAFMNPK